mmetsp:Transcript_3096/g.4561  ORF Transcript_3096/g.4561 Transcript_3096/m.4561 type:complete len:778 (+) Transcript_3096:35-2368(+)
MNRIKSTINRFNPFSHEQENKEEEKVEEEKKDESLENNENSVKIEWEEEYKKIKDIKTIEDTFSIELDSILSTFVEEISRTKANDLAPTTQTKKHQKAENEFRPKDEQLLYIMDLLEKRVQFFESVTKDTFIQNKTYIADVVSLFKICYLYKKEFIRLDRQRENEDEIKFMKRYIQVPVKRLLIEVHASNGTLDILIADSKIKDGSMISLQRILDATQGTLDLKNVVKEYQWVVSKAQSHLGDDEIALWTSTLKNNEKCMDEIATQLSIQLLRGIELSCYTKFEPKTKSEEEGELSILSVFAPNEEELIKHALQDDVYKYQDQIIEVLPGQQEALVNHLKQLELYDKDKIRISESSYTYEQVQHMLNSKSLVEHLKKWEVDVLECSKLIVIECNLGFTFIMNFIIGYGCGLSMNNALLRATQVALVGGSVFVVKYISKWATQKVAYHAIRTLALNADYGATVAAQLLNPFRIMVGLQPVASVASVSTVGRVTLTAIGDATMLSFIMEGALLAITTSFDIFNVRKGSMSATQAKKNIAVNTTTSVVSVTSGIVGGVVGGAVGTLAGPAGTTAGAIVGATLSSLVIGGATKVIARKATNQIVAEDSAIIATFIDQYVQEHLDKFLADYPQHVLVPKFHEILARRVRQQTGLFPIVNLRKLYNMRTNTFAENSQEMLKDMGLMYATKLMYLNDWLDNIQENADYDRTDNIVDDMKIVLSQQLTWDDGSIYAPKDKKEDEIEAVQEVHKTFEDMVKNKPKNNPFLNTDSNQPSTTTEELKE